MKRHYRITAILFLITIFAFGGVTAFQHVRFRLGGGPLNQQMNEETGRFEQEFNAVFAGKQAFINTNAAGKEALGSREMNDVVKLTNGSLTELRGPLDEEALKTEADNILSLYTYLQEQGIPFLYVSAPDKISPEDSYLPAGYEDHSNEMIDIFLQYLEEDSVPYLDLRQVFLHSDKDWYDWFYTTDHHWTCEAGYLAYCTITEELQNRYGIETDSYYTSRENYEELTFPHSLLGSWGQRTGENFAGADDFTLVLPKFETDVIRKYDWTEGDARDLVWYTGEIDPDVPGLVYDRSLASTTDFRNNGPSNTKKILFLGDSFSRTTGPFFIISFGLYDWEDCYKSASLTAEHIHDTDPNVVVLMHSPWNNLGREESFQYALP